ncbi:hypothetical protein GALMADRAFT_139297 [Galerina marginata CBS 339.88]|uniref:Uncharacterized protein n=1 Tax=Galerina marginata (strain CBS 339.88) TaxID=685588 RepID=A0A067TE88_GALM3|nr:hypothetical protein GALMADRAFT_139297 [Galerina marginata CBS 339.88]
MDATSQNPLQNSALVLFGWPAGHPVVLENIEGFQFITRPPSEHVVVFAIGPEIDDDDRIEELLLSTLRNLFVPNIRGIVILAYADFWTNQREDGVLQAISNTITYLELRFLHLPQPFTDVVIRTTDYIVPIYSRVLSCPADFLQRLPLDQAVRFPGQTDLRVLPPESRLDLFQNGLPIIQHLACILKDTPLLQKLTITLDVGANIGHLLPILATRAPSSVEVEFIEPTTFDLSELWEDDNRFHELEAALIHGLTSLRHHLQDLKIPLAIASPSLLSAIQGSPSSLRFLTIKPTFGICTVSRLRRTADAVDISTYPGFTELEMIRIGVNYYDDINHGSIAALEALFPNARVIQESCSKDFFPLDFIDA